MELLLRYRDNEDQATERRVSDIALVDHRSIVAFCHMRDAERTFVLARVESAVDPSTGELVNLYQLLGAPEPVAVARPCSMVTPPPVTPEEAKIQRNKDRRELYKPFRLEVLAHIAKQRLLGLFSDSCFNCGSPNQLEIDHHIPQALGGRMVPGNLVVLCRRCNGIKLDRDPTTFYGPRHLATLLPLLEAQHELFAFQFNFKAWDKDREGYLRTLGVPSDLIASVLDDENHPMYVGRGNDRVGVVISFGGGTKHDDAA